LQNAKFIAAQARQSIRLSQAELHSLRRSDEELVPGRMPVAIVDIFKSVEIEIQDGVMEIMVALLAADRLFQAVGEQRVIG